MPTNATSPPASRHHQRRRPVIGPDRPGAQAGVDHVEGVQRRGAGARRSSGGRRSGPRGRGRPAGPPRPGRRRRGRAPRARTPRWSARAGASTPARTACCSKRCQHSTIALRGSPPMASSGALLLGVLGHHLGDLGRRVRAPRTRRPRVGRRRRRGGRPQPQLPQLAQQAPDEEQHHADGEDLDARRRPRPASPAVRPAPARAPPRSARSVRVGAGRAVRRLVRPDPLDVAAGDHPVGADRGRPRDQDEQQPRGAEDGDHRRRTGAGGGGHFGNVTAGTDPKTIT